MVYTLSGHRGAISALVFNADGSRLVSGSQDTEIIVWDVGKKGSIRNSKFHVLKGCGLFGVLFHA